MRTIMKEPARYIVLYLLAASSFFRVEARLRGSKTTSEESVKINSSTKRRRTTAAKGNYIVLFQSGVSAATTEDSVAARANDLGKKYSIQKKNVYSSAMAGFAASNVTKEDAKNLRNEPGVLLVEKDAIVSIHEIFTTINQTEEEEEEDNVVEINGASSYRQRVPWSIKQVGWRDVENDEAFKTKRVYVIDTGVANIPDELNIDTKLARNFISEDVNAWQDCNGHGTHVAGTIAARNNSQGVVGVAAGIQVVPLRVLDCYGDGSLSDVINAINYVAKNAQPGDVVNLSFGGMVPQKSMDISVENAARLGIKFALSAGNDSRHTKDYSPARAQGEGIYTVCAVDYSKSMASFTNYGIPPVDICAPGVNIASLTETGQVTKRSGTSMAAPHVAGLLLLESLQVQGYAQGPQDGGSYALAHQ